MAVIKICDSSLVDGDDGAPLFDDDDYENSEFIDSQNCLGNDLTVRIIYKLQQFCFLLILHL